MNPKITPWLVWPVWFLWCGFISWRFTQSAGAAVITFLVLTVPVVLWVRWQIKKRQGNE